MSMNIIFFNNYKIGIDFIDKENYILFKLTDEIYQSIFDEHKSLFLLNKFNEIIKLYFKTKENFMEEIVFPYRKYHKEAHDIILIKVINFLENKSKYDTYQQKYFIKTIDDCLLKHIDHYDTQIGIFFKNQTK